jgi:hypothetical protein
MNNNDDNNSDDRCVTRSSAFRIGMGMTGILSFLTVANHLLGTPPDDALQHRRLALRNDYKTVVARVPQPLRGQYDETLKDDAATMSFADAVNLEKFNFINSRLAGKPGVMNIDGKMGDLPLEYSLRDVIDSDIMADELHPVVKEQADHMLLAKHIKAKQGCSSAGADVLDSGGWCLTPNTGKKATSIIGYNGNEIVIPNNHIVASPRIVGELLTFIEDERITSINDFGAGVGQYKSEILQKLPNFNWNAYDGAGNVEEYTKGFLKWFDLTLPLELPKADWVISLEVGEHVPNEFEGMLIRNLHHHNCKGIILSWGTLGQGGHSHINNHSNDYIISVFNELGYIKDVDMKARLRNPEGNYRWFTGSVMVFRRSVASSSLGCSH